MAKLNEQDNVKFRYGLAIKKLIDRNKKINISATKKGTKDLSLDDSYSTISSSTGLRPATLSDIVNGISDIKGYTLFQILGSLGYTYSQFGKVFDSISEEEIVKYQEEIEKRKM